MALVGLACGVRLPCGSGKARADAGTDLHHEASIGSGVDAHAGRAGLGRVSMVTAPLAQHGVLMIPFPIMQRLESG